MIYPLVIGIVLGALLFGGLYLAVRFVAKKRFSSSLGLSLLLIKIPREQKEKGGKDEIKSEIGKFEQLLGSLASAKEPFTFEVAVPHIGEEIHFYIAITKKWAEVATKQIQGLWNGASVEAVHDDYNVFNAQGSSVAAYVKQKERFVLPIRTYQGFDADSFGAILGSFAKVNELGEGAALQCVIRPAPSKTKAGLRKTIDLLKKGSSLKDVLSVSFLDTLKSFGQGEKKETESKVVDDQAIKAIEEKIAKPLFEVNIRLVASAGSPFQANDILEGLAAGLEQFSAPERNSLLVIKPRQANKLIYQFIFRAFDGGQALVLNSEEIASLYHFPLSSTETPRVKWLKSKEASPPSDLPSDGTLIGESSFRGEHKRVYITDDDRRRHTYIIGQTGTGKSTLLSNMIIEDIAHGKGVAMIDPHGDLVETVLSRIPAARKEDVIVFDPGDIEKPLGLNMLEYNFHRPEERTFIVNEMQGILNKLFPPETMGPMFEQYMRNALLLLMEDAPNEPATLVEVPRVFTDSEFRLRKLSRIHNPIVVDFWQKEAAKAGGEGSLANMTPYITSKFNNFISNDYMRPIIGQSSSAFNFRQVMDDGKILLVNLSKGRIGDINAGLLGMVITGKILMSALSRVDTPDAERRRDFNLYIDEFQNFTTDSVSTILSEARKYGLSLTMAHQFIAQLTEKIRDAVFGNVGTQIVFRVGAKDAEFLVKQFEPTFNENDLLNIDNFRAYVKLLIKGQTSRPFNIQTFPLTLGDKVLAAEIKDTSRTRYGKERLAIEGEIYKRLRD